MSDYIINVKNLEKSYPILEKVSQRWSHFLSVLLNKKNRQRKVILKNINFEVRRGESLALIGENGAGKSTLLKLVCGVLHPGEGTVECNGRIGALLELGAGFNPEYTGRQNIKLAALLAGLSEQEVEERTEAILNFADIGDSINEAVKNYSSGMVVRLGFAIITAIKPDILITDEVLAVGDESFQQKCIKWLEKYLAEGGTLLLVSHSMFHVKKLCRHAIWLKDTTVKMQGNAGQVADAYLAWHHKKNQKSEIEKHQQVSGSDPGYRLVSCNWCGDQNYSDLQENSSLIAEIILHSPDTRPPNAFIGVVTLDGHPVYGVGTELDGYVVQHIKDTHYSCVVEVSLQGLLPGVYLFKAHAMDPEGLRVSDTLELEFTISGTTRELGMVRLEHSWRNEA